MNTTHRTAQFAAALLAALAALLVAAPLGAASTLARPPKVHGMHVRWYRWHPTHRTLANRGNSFGSTAVVGVESMRDLAQLRARYGFDHVRRIPALHAAEVHVDSKQLHALLANAARDPRIRYVSPLGPRRRTMGLPDDPLLHTIDGTTNLPDEWQFGAADVGPALDISKGNPNIVVGIIDTGAAQIPDLAGKIDSLWSVTNGAVQQDFTDNNDDYGHGTAVASLIAANDNDGFGMAGFGGATHVIVVHAGDQGWFEDANVALALNKLVSLGVRVVNMSLGGRIPSDPILVDAIHAAAAAGVLLVASAGNDYGYVGWPAADLQPSGGGRSYGLVVGASTEAGGRANFSDYGKHLSLMAPGDYGGLCTGVLVALPPGNMFSNSCYLTWTGSDGAVYGNLAGTSFAAPEVAAIAALIWAARPDLTNYQVADILKQSAQRTSADWTPGMGCGILDAGAALELATSRPASAWSQMPNTTGAVCSALGDAPATWPTEQDQTITFDAIPNKRVGDPDFKVKATASSGLKVKFSATGVCTIKGNVVHLLVWGVCTITATQAGNAFYNVAPSASRSFTVGKARHRAKPRSKV